MFGRKSRLEQKVNTVIDKTTTIEGVLSHESSLRVDGKITGEVICKGNVYIGKSGFIESKIDANNIIISGKAVGNLYAKETVHIQETGQLTGNVKASGIIIDNGGVFNGESTITGKEKRVENRKISKTSEASP